MNAVPLDLRFDQFRYWLLYRFGSGLVNKKGNSKYIKYQGGANE